MVRITTTDGGGKKENYKNVNLLAFLTKRSINEMNII
jgi:hypothetical protein